jgi:hypothetical protein
MVLGDNILNYGRTGVGLAEMFAAVREPDADRPPATPPGRLCISKILVSYPFILP